MESRKKINYNNVQLVIVFINSINLLPAQDMQYSSADHCKKSLHSPVVNNGKALFSTSQKAATDLLQM